MPVGREQRIASLLEGLLLCITLDREFALADFLFDKGGGVGTRLLRRRAMPEKRLGLFVAAELFVVNLKPVALRVVVNLNAH